MALSKEIWQEIEKKYCFGIVNAEGFFHFPSYEELGKEYGINRSSIKRAADRIGWGITKENFKNKN